MADPNAIEGCAETLAQARSVVLSTGAGMSQESGIPTFRDAPNALWANFRPEQLATREGFRSDPTLVWRWYAERRRMISAAHPNPGHLAIVNMESLVENVVVITQNIDNLHREAGSTRVIEVHGNIFRYKCFDRDHPVESNGCEGKDVPPRCPCGSLVRPDIVWFGEMLHAEAIDEAYTALETCDVVVVVGTSGTVYPAAGFAEVARRHRAHVIEINPEETPMTREADVFLQGPAGDVLPKLVSSLKAHSKRGTYS